MQEILIIALYYSQIFLESTMSIMSTPNQYKIVLNQSIKKLALDPVAIATPVPINFQDLITGQDINDHTIEKGASFWSLALDYKPIYENFHLLSYFAPSRQVTIIDRVYGNPNDSYICYDIFKIGCKDETGQPITGLNKTQQSDQLLLLILRQKDNFNPQQQLKMVYQLAAHSSKTPIIDLKQVKSLGFIPVTFSQKNDEIVTQEERQFLNRIITETKEIDLRDRIEQITVTVSDTEDGWIERNLREVLLEQDNYRISKVRKSRSREVEYFYKEPQNIRNRVFTEEHIGLALQGGGVKGVQYIGAYKAITEQPKPIKSIIGSSAGGILGLAVCCNVPSEKIVEICIEILSHIADKDQNFRTVDENGKKKLEEYYKLICDLVRDLNILDTDIQDTLNELFGDKKFQQLIKNLITQVTNPEVGKLFTDRNNQQLNLLGLVEAALMTGNQVCEIAVECVKFLLIRKRDQSQEFGKNIKFKELYELSKGLVQKGISEADSNRIKDITMAQLYELTGIQFTCTAVDINNHILRFFNQKTTPDLPVCRAVQMTGSFPVAFEAQSWQSAWGKYYIHYDYIRKEIDLTGCKFTDGGTLANFPIKYLDNEDMRPMYFSHVKTAQTFIYGIGFATNIQKDKSKGQKISKVLQDVFELGKSKISKWKAVWKWFKGKFSSSPKPEKTKVSIDDVMLVGNTIPVFLFLGNILATYSKSKDNLIDECFQHMCFETRASKLYKKEVENQPTFKDEEQRNKIIQSLATQIKEILLPENQTKSILDIFLQNLQFIKNGNKYKMLNQVQICFLQKILYYTMQDFLYYLLKDKSQEEQDKILEILYNKILEKTQGDFKLKLKKYESKPREGIAAVLDSLVKLSKEKIFVLSEIRKDYEMLGKVCQGIENFCVNGDQKTAELTKKWVSQALNESSQCERAIVKKIIYNITSLTKPQTKNKKSTTRRTVELATKLQYLTMTLPISSIALCLSTLKSFPLPQFSLASQQIRRQDNLKSYILKRISTQLQEDSMIEEFAADTCRAPQEEKGLHVVVESAPLSELYLHWYLVNVGKIVLRCNEGIRRRREFRIGQLREEARKRQLQDKDKSTKSQPQNIIVQSKKLKISAITITGYQSLIAFLHASDLPDQFIEEEIWKIRGLIKINIDEANKKLQSLDWLKLTPLILRELYQSSIQNQKDIFTYIEEDLKIQSKQFGRLQQLINGSFNSINLTKDQLMEEIQVSLSYVMKIIYELEKSKGSSEQVMQNLISNLAINSPEYRAADKMKVYSQSLGEMCSFFFKKYSEIVKFIALNSPRLVDDVMKTLSPGDRKYAWQAAITPGLISNKDIKKFVIDVLEKLQLKANITLLDFYKNSSKKIQLNFSVVEDSIIAIINHVTRPNMPLLDAILATSAIPEFSKPVLDRKEWQYKSSSDFNRRKLLAYFQPQKVPYTFLYSSSAITSMPLDLLQNNAFKRRINKNPNTKDIFLIFSFQDFKLSNLNKLMLETIGSKEAEYKFTVTKLTMAQLMNNFVSIGATFANFFGINIQNVKQKRNVQGLKLIKGISPITSKLNLFGLYLESHDNLIRDLYKEYLVLMPIRFSTLDFNVISTPATSTSPEKLSDKTQDAIMQAHYVVKEKLENKFQAGQIIRMEERMLMSNKIIMGLQEFQKEGKRILYFRVETVAVAGQQNNKSRVMNMDESSHLLNTQPQITTQSQKLKVRFLSMLNSSHQLFQMYYICKKNQKGVYERIKDETIFIEEGPDNEVNLKIQYPRGNNSHVNCKYFKLIFTKLYTLANGVKQQNGRYGLVYAFQFDILYTKWSYNNILRPVINYEYDYMNESLIQKVGNNLVPKYPPEQLTIEITSDIKDTLYESIACYKCIYPLQLDRSTMTSGAILRCTNSQTCTNSYALLEKYYVKYNKNQDQGQQDGLTCLFDHPLLLAKVQGQGQLLIENIRKGIQFKTCDLCGRGSLKELWKDQGCHVQVCEKCVLNTICVVYERD